MLTPVRCTIRTLAYHSFALCKSPDITKELERFSNPFSYGEWLLLGHLTRKGHPGLYRSQVIPSLPEEVRFVACKIVKLFPSLIAITFEVYLEEKATEELLKQQERIYIPKIRVNNLFPFGKRRRSISTYAYSQQNIQNVSDWTDNLRIKIERIISRHIKGYFLQHKNTDKGILPSIEIYGIEGETPIVNSEDWHKWSRDAQNWLESFRIDFSLFPYIYNWFIFSFPAEIIRMSTKNNSYRPVNQQVILLSDDLRNYVAKTYGHNDDHRIVYMNNHYTEDLITFTTTYWFLKFNEIRAKRLSKAMFSVIKRKGNLNRYIHYRTEHTFERMIRVVYGMLLLA